MKYRPTISGILLRTVAVVLDFNITYYDEVFHNSVSRTAGYTTVMVIVCFFIADILDLRERKRVEEYNRRKAREKLEERLRR